MTRQEKLNAMAGVLPKDVMEMINARCSLRDTCKYISTAYGRSKGVTGVEKDELQYKFDELDALLSTRLQYLMDKYLMTGD